MSAVRDARRSELHAFLRGIQRAGRPVETFRDDERMVAAGLIDSLAILQVVSWLETTHGIDFAESGIDPERLGTIGGILDVIEERRGAA